METKSKVSAKEGFKSDRFAKLVGDLVESGVAISYTQEKNRLTINGDLTVDIVGLDINVRVFDGVVHSNVDIAGDLLIESGSHGYSVRSGIDLNNTSVKAKSIITHGGQQLVTGKGELIATEEIKIFDVSSSERLLMQTPRIACGNARGPITMNARDTIWCSNMSGVEATTAHLSCKGRIDQNSEVVTDYCVADTIADGAKVFAFMNVICNQIGRPSLESPKTIVAADGKVYSAERDELMVHNAEVFSRSSDAKNIFTLQVEGHEKSVDVTAEFGNLSSEAQDWVRVGYERCRHTFGRAMPTVVGRAIQQSLDIR